MEICGSLFEACKSFKSLRADVYSHTRSTIWLNCHCGGLFEMEYIEAKRLLTSIDSFRKKTKVQSFDIEEFEVKLYEFKQDLKEKVEKLSEKCIHLGLAYT